MTKLNEAFVVTKPRIGSYLTDFLKTGKKKPCMGKGCGEATMRLTKIVYVFCCDAGCGCEIKIEAN